MTTAYIFSDSNTLQSGFRNVDPKKVHYTIKTSPGTGPKERQITELVPTENNAHDAPHGAIDWKKSGIIVGDVEKKISELRHAPGDITTGTRAWKWDGKEYDVGLSGQQWIITSELARSTHNIPSATFTPLKSGVSGPAQMSIQFSEDVTPKDMVFLTLVLIYSDTERNDEAQA